MPEDLDEEAFAKDIDTVIRNLNSMFEVAKKRDIAVQVTMITNGSVPALRLDGVYKKLNKPLIYRV
jgi:hypothetical protein